MKKLFSLIVSTLLFQFALAQQEVYKIIYTLSLDESFKSNIKELGQVESDETELFLSLLAEMEGKPLMEVWISEHQNKIHNLYFPPTLQLRDTKNKTLFFLDSLSKSFSKEVYAPESEFNLRVNLDSETTEMIAGFPSKLATIELQDDSNAEQPESVEVWYTDKIPAIFWGKYQYLDRIPGLALRVNAFGAAFQVMEISKTQVPENFFDIPSDYTDEELTEMDLGDGMTAYYDSTSFLFGLKNPNGEIITQPNYLTIAPFNNGIAVAVDEGNFAGLIDAKGKNLTEFKFDNIQYDPVLNAYLFSLEGMMSVMDAKGNKLWNNEFEYITPFSADYTIVMTSLKFGLADQKGNIVLPLGENVILSNDNKYYVSEKDGLYEIYQIDGNKLITSGDYYLGLSNEDDLFIISKDSENFGLINSKGETILPLEYSYINPFENGKAIVLKNGESEEKVINSKGKFISNP